MWTRALASLTLMLALSAGANPMPMAGNARLDRAPVVHRARVVDDVDGCRELAPAPVPVPPTACADGEQP